MTDRRRFLLFLLPLAAASCGRLGYDDLRDGAGSGPGLSTGGSSGGNDPDGGIRHSGSGGAGGDSGATTGNGGSQVGSGSGGLAADGATSGGGATEDGATGSGGAMGTGGSIVDAGLPGGTVGCADGQREGFVDLVTYPDIAACAGGFAFPGVIGLAGPMCGHGGGDDGPFPDGTGCDAFDLCAIGFHLCTSVAEVTAKSSTGCAGAAVGALPSFYAMAQPGAGQAKCGATGTDDVYGCGTMGGVPNVDCSPLNAWSGDQCKSLTAPWSCAGAKTTEALTVVKPGAAGGGVLCCRD